VPHQPPPQLPGHNPIVPAGPSTDPTGGPALAGTLPAAPNVPPGSVPSSPTTAVPGPSVQPGTIIGGGGGFSPFRGVSRGKGSGFPVGRGLNSGGKPATPTWLPASHGQPGVFGATGQPARASQPRSPARRRGIASAGPLSEDRSRRSDDERDIEFDPDDPWATAEGVPPVIEPSRAQPRHDPGPGVIGRYE